jgi:MFS family permease
MAVTTARAPGDRHGRRRLAVVVTAGLVDSLCLSVAWTVLVLRIADEHGLAAVGVCSAAMLLGVALSAPIAGRVAVRLEGRRLLRTAAGVEMVLRGGLALLVLSGAPVVLLALCTAAMNVSAWTGYAGMRAEVAAVRPGAVALTWYGTAIAAVEAVGVAVAAFLPAETEAVFPAVMVVYVLALVPTVVIAGASPVRRALPAGARARRGPPSGLAVLGGLLMLLGSAPTLLYVALAEDAHGRTAVAAAAVAFVVGSLLAGPTASALQRRPGSPGPRYVLAAVGMVAGWVVAPLSVPLLCAAQVLSGLCMTLLEGLLDSAAVAREPHRVTGALASVTAGRALGSAAGTAVLPLVVLQTGLPLTAAAATAVLVLLAALTLAGTRRSAVGSEPAPRLLAGAVS